MNDWNTNENALLRGARMRTRRHAERHQRRLEVVVRDEPRRELDAGMFAEFEKPCSPFALSP